MLIISQPVEAAGSPLAWFAGEAEADSLLAADARADVKLAHNYLSTNPSPLRTSAIHKAKIAEAV